MGIRIEFEDFPHLNSNVKCTFIALNLHQLIDSKANNISGVTEKCQDKARN